MVHKGRVLDPILSHMNAVHNFATILSLQFLLTIRLSFKLQVYKYNCNFFASTGLIIILILSSHQNLDFPRCLFSSGYPTKILFEFLICTMRAACLLRDILLDLIFPIVISEDELIEMDITGLT
jgi:hypothetical protein